jgi:nuclear protein localization protein 4 homolog
VTHGFPQDPSPLFRSSKFKIENRLGLEEQRIEAVLSALAALDAPNVLNSELARPGEAHKRFELAEFLSDYHLVVFLGTTQLLSVVSNSRRGYIF